MSLEAKLLALVNAIGPDIKALKIADGNLSALSTTAKGNLVAAINEVYAIAQAASGQVIDDAAGDGIANRTWSADKIGDEIAEAITLLRDELRDGAGSALDTFKEVADAIAADQSTAAALATAVGNRVRFDDAQALNNTQKGQARTNIGAAAAADLIALTTAVGNTEQDLVAAYVAAKA